MQGYHLVGRKSVGRKEVDRLPLWARHRGRPHGIRNALSALEGRNAHHIGVSFGGFVLVLEANVLVAVIPGCDAGEESIAC